MKELPAQARKMLQVARDRQVPSEREREAMFSAVVGSLGPGAFWDPSDASAGPEHGAGAEPPPDTAGGPSAEPYAGMNPAGAGGASIGPAGADAATMWSGKMASSTLLTWRFGKLVLVSIAAGGAAFVMSIAVPGAQPAHSGRAAPSAHVTAVRQAPPRNEPTGPRGPSSTPSRDDGSASSPAAQAVSAPDASERGATGRSLEGRASAPLASRSTGQVADGTRRSPRRTTRASAEESASEQRAELRPSAEAEPATGAPSDVVAPAAERAPEPTPAPQRAAPQVTDARELMLVRNAIASLRDHAPAAALAQLEEHAQRYPDSALATERSGLQIVALCEAGRLADALRLQPAFFAVAGSSPLAERARRACQQEPR